jgi:hypothetical protein
MYATATGIMRGRKRKESVKDFSAMNKKNLIGCGDVIFAAGFSAAKANKVTCDDRRSERCGCLNHRYHQQANMHSVKRQCSVIVYIVQLL